VCSSDLGVVRVGGPEGKKLKGRGAVEEKSNIKKHIDEAAIELIKEWVGDEDVELDDGARQSCNEGGCDLIADAVLKKVPGAKIRVAETKEKQGHVWIEYKGKHYDAEATDGVDSPEELKFFKRKGPPITANQFNFVVNDCGTGKGGFKPGNTCAKGSDGVAGPGSQVPKGFKAVDPEAKDSLQRYRQEDGSLTPERSALHDRIIAKFSQKATPVDNPTFVMMGGGSAAGKSNLLNSGVISIDPNSVMVDSDEIKGMLPEYVNMVDKNNPSSAAFVHEESSWIASRLYRESLAESKNILLDGTGNNTLESVQRKVQEAKDYGAKVKAFYVTVDTETALERNRLRAQKTGRLVPEVFVRKAHAAVSRILPDLLSNGVFDELELYDTNQNSVRLVVSSKGSEYKIKDETLWNNFKAKANQ
jgi:predicted ABC-type ATPase